MSGVLGHLLGVTLPLLVVPTAVLLVAIRWGREGFREDYPPDIAALMPPPTRSETVRGWIFGGGFIVSLAAAIGTSTYLFLRDDGGGFATAYLVTLLGVVAFVVIDLVVVDWLVVCWWRPGWVVIPGTEDCAGWDDYAFHARVLATPKAIVANLLLPLPVAAVDLWLA